MLTELTLIHFKSWCDTEALRLAPITGFFGSNSSGKTSLLQSLLLLKQTADSPDNSLVLQFEGNLVSLGDFRSVIFDHDVGSELTFALKWTEPKPITIKDPLNPNRFVAQSPALQFQTTIRGENGSGKSLRLVVSNFRYAVGETAFGMRRKSEQRLDYELFMESEPAASFKFIRNQGRGWQLPSPTKCYGFPDQARAYYQNAGFLSDLELALENLLRRIYYLGPLRAYPERTYLWAGAQPSDMGRAGEQAIDALLSSRDREKSISQGKGRKRMSLEEYVAQWLQTLGLIAEFAVRPVAEGSQIFQVWVKKTQDAPEVLITDVGFGVSQILPVIVLCFYVPEGSTIILEQPEIHLHPSVQAGLADVLIDAVKKRKVQIILESHSEHLLKRLQRRVAEGEWESESVALYFCETEASASKITPLQMDLFGNIENWPKDFFGDQFGEMAETHRARMHRIQKETAL